MPVDQVPRPNNWGLDITLNLIRPHQNCHGNFSFSFFSSFSFFPPNYYCCRVLGTVGCYSLVSQTRAILGPSDRLSGRLPSRPPPVVRPLPAPPSLFSWPTSRLPPVLAEAVVMSASRSFRSGIFAGPRKQSSQRSAEVFSALCHCLSGSGKRVWLDLGGAVLVGKCNDNKVDQLW